MSEGRERKGEEEKEEKKWVEGGGKGEEALGTEGKWVKVNR